MDIGGFGARWELMDSNELHGVGPRDGTGALCKAVYLCGAVRGPPEMTLTAVT